MLTSRKFGNGLSDSNKQPSRIEMAAVSDVHTDDHVGMQQFQIALDFQWDGDSMSIEFLVHVL